MIIENLDYYKDPFIEMDELDETKRVMEGIKNENY
jgi:hypothetical protein